MGAKGTAAIGRWGMAIIPAVPVLFAGLQKFTRAPQWEADFVNWGLSASYVPIIGALEVAAAIALLVPLTRFYGAASVIVLMLGAAVTRFASGEMWGLVPLLIAAAAALSGWWARPYWFHDMVMKMRREKEPEPQGTVSRRKKS